MSEDNQEDEGEEQEGSDDGLHHMRKNSAEHLVRDREQTETHVGEEPKTSRSVEQAVEDGKVDEGADQGEDRDETVR